MKEYFDNKLRLEREIGELRNSRGETIEFITEKHISQNPLNILINCERDRHELGLSLDEMLELHLYLH